MFAIAILDERKGCRREWQPCRKVKYRPKTRACSKISQPSAVDVWDAENGEAANAEAAPKIWHAASHASRDYVQLVSRRAQLALRIPPTPH